MIQNIYLLTETVPYPDKAEAFSSPIEALSNFSDTIQNIWWLIGLFFLAFIIFCSICFFRKIFNKYSQKQMDALTQNKKYIPGLFVELNSSKEMLRYFIYNRKWKNRLIKSYNLVYDNFYGDILKKACREPGIQFHMKRSVSLKEINTNIEHALTLHERFAKGEGYFEPAYKESQILFEILHYPYTNALEELHLYSLAGISRYIVLTGSAGNGKTNLLCSITELLINMKKPVLFLNAADMNGDIMVYLAKQLNLPEKIQSHMNIYFALINLLLSGRNQYLYLIIDAVNENRTEEFNGNLSHFINQMLDFRHVKVIVSCRNEYYQDRFQKTLTENIHVPAMEYDLKTLSYTPAAIERIVKAYREYFRFTGSISPAVLEVMTRQLLLLRIFFEVYQDSNADIHSIHKHKLFAKYIEKVTKENGKNAEILINKIADIMLNSKKYDGICMEELEKIGISRLPIDKVIDGSILISTKIVQHKGTIAETESEVIYFVFDELRDYLLAKRLILRNVTPEFINGNAILSYLKKLNNTAAPCAEGVIHYTYIFFRTDAMIEESGQKDKFCQRILNFCRNSSVREQRNQWYSRGREEFTNLGMRILLTMNLSLLTFEKSYIRDCLKNDPEEDGGVLFDTFLNNTIYMGANDLDDYIDILFGMETYEQMCNAFLQITDFNGFTDKKIPQNLTRIHRGINEQSPEGARQIQKIAELFLLCFTFNNDTLLREFTGYFESLSDHEEIKNEMLHKLKQHYRLEKKHE